MVLVTSSGHSGNQNSCTFLWLYLIVRVPLQQNASLDHAMIYGTAADAVRHEFSKERADCDCAVGHSLFRRAMEQRGGGAILDCFPRRRWRLTY